MRLVFTHLFGNFVPDDEIEVPDGAIYDHSYLKPVPPAAPTTKTKDKME
jgi:hypothetical protein